MRIRGVGPVPCEFMFIAPSPGPQEDRDGIPFAGKAGDELERYLNGVDLPERDDIYITNLHKQYKGKKYVYTQEDVDQALPELQAELQQVTPRIIIAMGREVARLFLGDVDITDCEGIPWYLPDTCELTKSCKALVPGKTIIFPLVHIAAGMRNPELSPYVVRGFAELSDFLDGKVQARKLFDDPIPNPHYQEITDVPFLRTVLKFVTARTELSIDTEGWPQRPWSLQFSYKPGVAYLIRMEHADLLAAFADHIHQVRPKLVFHSSLHEFAMQDPLGVPMSDLLFDDTMVMAYLLQLVPQGLKPGCLRYCNMPMSDYSDIVGDKANDLARDYLTWIWDAEQLEWEERCEQEFVRLTTTPYTDAKGKVHAGRKLKVHPKLPKSALHKATLRVLGSKRPHSLWQDQILDLQVAAYKRLGDLPDATLDYVDPARSIPYGCRDADGTGRLLPEYRRRLTSLGLEDVYQLELSTYPLIARMHKVGVKPDLDQFAILSDILQSEVERLQDVLNARTGRPAFNANSGDQVADYLFDHLGLDEVKLTSSGRGSTNDKILEALEHEHPEFPVISEIREYRETYKLKNTFVDRLPDYTHRYPFDGRIHATFRTTRVITGRLAAADPNLLAQPEHGQWADYFKLGWIAEDGHVICAWDQSQIELRGLAHLSGDPLMMAVFRGEKRNPDGSLIDLHAALAERIFGVKPKDQDKHKHRLPAKAINFGIPMGMTCKGLSVELRKNGVDANEDTAQRWLDDTLRLYSGVATFQKERAAEARRNGFIRCLSGRIRYIGGIRSRDERVRAEAERFAFSTPVQESAQFIMKQAEARVWNEVLPYFWKQGHWVEPILQIHDCLKMECDAGIKDALNKAIREVMISVPKGFVVPLDVEGEFGYNAAPIKREIHGKPDPCWYNPKGTTKFKE